MCSCVHVCVWAVCCGGVQVRHRLLHTAWRVSLRPDHLLRLLQCCRLLSRDNVLRQRLVEAGGVKVRGQGEGGGQGAHANLGKWKVGTARREMEKSGAHLGGLRTQLCAHLVMATTAGPSLLH